jgi:transcriptional regulator with XRE-family HTH domain
MWETFELDEDDVVAIVGAKWLGLAVKRRRYRLKLSQRRLENLCGIDQTVISRLENGRLKGIRFARLLTLIGTLGGLDEDSPLPWFEDPHPRPFVTLMGDDDDREDDEFDDDAPRAG